MISYYWEIINKEWYLCIKPRCNTSSSKQGQIQGNVVIFQNKFSWKKYFEIFFFSVSPILKYSQVYFTYLSCVCFSSLTAESFCPPFSSVPTGSLFCFLLQLGSLLCNPLACLALYRFSDWLLPRFYLQVRGWADFERKMGSKEDGGASED